jgi:hypothetical protein
MRRLVSLLAICEIPSIPKGWDESLARSGETYTARKSEQRVFYSARTANRHR